MKDYDIFDIYNTDPRAPWNQPDYCTCEECGIEAVMKDDGDPPDDWALVDRGDRPGNEGEPAVALGDGLVCGDCLEDLNNERDDYARSEGFDTWEEFQRYDPRKGEPSR